MPSEQTPVPPVRVGPDKPSGNDPYIYFKMDGSDNEKPSIPTFGQIVQVEDYITRGRADLLSKVEHNEIGIDTGRVKRFLTRYGLKMTPFLAVARDNGVLGETTDPYMQENGGYLPELGITYVIRDKKREATNGVGITEAVLVHEEAHADTDYPTTGFAFPEDETPIVVRFRNGFTLENVSEDGHNQYFEEGFAGLMQNRYVVEELGLPHGFSKTDSVPKVSAGEDIVYELPQSYFIPKSAEDLLGIPDISAHAAFGMELLIAKDPEILDAIIRSRTDVEGLRDFARRVSKLHPGLYTLLGRQPYQEVNFMAATQYIINELYGGDTAKAAETVRGRMSLAA
jgi:hypothetical protein